MSDIVCDLCPKNALYTLLIQDLVKEKDGIQEPIRFFCMEHTVKRVNACLTVVGRYSISIDPTGQKQGAPVTRKKGVVNGRKRVDNDDSVAAEVNRFS